MIYVIVRRGVYRHEILGNHTDPRQAIEQAVHAIKQERDSYHNMEIVELTPNSMNEERVAYVISRQDEDIVRTVPIHDPKLLAVGIELPIDFRKVTDYAGITVTKRYRDGKTK